MPTYEYVCRACGHHLEVVQKFSDAPLDTCERCHGELRKKFSAAGIIFKGSGYYVTDTRAGDGKSATGAGARTSGGGSNGSSGGGTTDSSSSDSASTTSSGSSQSESASA